MTSEIGEIQRFEYSGRVAPRFAFVAVFGWALVALLGLLYQQLLTANPLVLLNPALTILLGFLVGALAMGCLRAGKVRNTGVARIWCACLALSCVAWAHLESMGFGREGFPGIGQALSNILGVGGGQQVLLWFTELVLIVALAVPLPLAWWRRAVFDEEADSFLVRRRIAVRYGPSAQLVHDRVYEAGVETLLNLGLRKHAENSEEGELRFYLHESISRNKAWLTVQWYGKLEGPRGRKVLRDVLVLRRVAVEPALVTRLIGD